MLPRSALRPPGGARRQAVLLLAGALAHGLSAAADPEPVLNCRIETGGEVSEHAFVPVADPYAVQPVRLNTHFLFKATVIGASGRLDQVALYTYFQGSRQLELLQESVYRPDQLEAVQDGASLTGEQWVYAPGLGREFRYQCWLHRTPVMPVGSPAMSAQSSATPAEATAMPAESTASAGPEPATAAQAAPAWTSLAVAGDVMLADGPGRVLARGRDPLSEVAGWLDQAELRIANLECVVSDQGTPEPGKPYTFRARPQVIPVLKRHFDALGIANNHSGDFGPEAFSDMLGRLDRAGLPYFGGGYNLELAHRPLVLERGGLRIALLAYDNFLPRHFEAGYDLPGVAWAEPEQLARDIRLARSLHGADLVIPFLHWGVEYEPLANLRQRTLARQMIDAGADAVIGAHPHVVQDVETWHGKPILYSLGNFVFDGFHDAPTTTGWMVRLDLDRQGVVRWRTRAVHLDAEGIPHPGGAQEAQCWERGAPAPTAGDCAVSVPALPR